MSEEPKPTAPYGPFSTFETALNHLAALKGIPPKIDRSVFPSMGGDAKGYVLNAFKFFGLTDDKGMPQPLLSELALNKETRQATMRKIIKDRYPSISEADLGTTTIPQLDGKLGDKIYNVSGGTRQKARSFLLKAAEFSGIPLSGLLTAKGPRGPRQKRTKQKTNGGGSVAEQKGKIQPPEPPPLDPANVRMPISLSPDRVVYIEMPKDLAPKDAKKLLALLGLSLDVAIQFPEGM
jgi:hypothetical protein